MVVPKFRVWDTFEEDMVNDIFFSWQDREYESLNECLSDERWKFMQSTGLVDKNGQEIFEKDIIKNKDGRLAIVKWHASYASFVYIWLDELKKEKQDWQPLYLAYMKFEIIGNVYENPELLVR